MCTVSPIFASQIRTDLSREPDTTRVPSCEMTTHQTKFECPTSMRSNSPVAVSQIRTELSHDPDTTRLPSLENITEVTSARCRMICSDVSPHESARPTTLARGMLHKDVAYFCRSRDC